MSHTITLCATKNAIGSAISDASSPMMRILQSLTIDILIVRIETGFALNVAVRFAHTLMLDLNMSW